MNTFAPDTERLVIDELVRHWNADVRPNVVTNACVLSARIASEVLAYFGIRHDVIPMAAMAMNDRMLEHQNSALDHAQWDPEAWSVGVGFGNNMVAINKDSRDGTGFDGHVVVVTANHYVDLTAYQFDRIAQGIDTGGSLVVPNEAIVHPYFLSPGSPNPWFYFALRQGHMVVLNNRNHAFKNSPDWRIHYRRQSGDIIRAIRAHLRENLPLGR